ncbi:hypothetical protein GW17_00040754, partial [Ensete ventricosum]
VTSSQLLLFLDSSPSVDLPLLFPLRLRSIENRLEWPTAISLEGSSSILTCCPLVGPLILGGVFKLELFLPEEYPMAAPKPKNGPVYMLLGHKRVGGVLHVITSTEL